MIKEIKVMNRFGAEMVLLGLTPIPSLLTRWALLSINGFDEPFLVEGKSLRNMEKSGLEMVMSIRFDDIKGMEYEKIKVVHPKIILFNEGHAKKIIEFIDLLQRKQEPTLLLIHCSAGVSRSGAVATFVSEYLSVPFSDEYILPNSYILEILRNTAKDYEIIRNGEQK